LDPRLSYDPAGVKLEDARLMGAGMGAVFKAAGIEVRPTPSALVVETSIRRLETTGQGPLHSEARFQVKFRKPNGDVVGNASGSAHATVEPVITRDAKRFSETYVVGNRDDLMRGLGERIAAQIVSFMESDGKSQSINIRLLTPK